MSIVDSGRMVRIQVGQVQKQRFRESVAAIHARHHKADTHLSILMKGQCVLAKEGPTLAEEHAADTVLLDGDLAFTQNAAAATARTAIGGITEQTACATARNGRLAAMHTASGRAGGRWTAAAREAEAVDPAGQGSMGAIVEGRRRVCRREEWSKAAIAGSAWNWRCWARRRERGTVPRGHAGSGA